MKILWVPHAPLRSGRTRAEHLMEGLAQKHDLHVFNFRIHPRQEYFRYLLDLAGEPIQLSRLGIEEIFLRRLPKAQWLNGLFLNAAIEHHARRCGAELLVVSNNPYLIGYVDFQRHRSNLPIVCDFFDGGDWSSPSKSSEYEKLYVRSSDTAVAVSHLLTTQAKSVNPSSYLVRNGVELGRYHAFRDTHTTSECKRALGIDPDAFVISVIGMTCSPRLYFVDAVLSLAKAGRKVCLLLVGDSNLLPEIKERFKSAPEVVRIEGTVPYENIMPYFMASDVGLNVVDDEPYYHRQSPLKIFEYAAMGKPVVVAPRLDEVERNALSNVVFCEAGAGALAKCLTGIADGKFQVSEPDLAAYDWETLTASFEDILIQTRERWLAKRTNKNAQV